MPQPIDRPPIADAPISVILPAFNVAADIRAILRGWTAYLESLNRDYEIYLIDDGSTDGTGQIADESASETPRLLVIHHPAKLGIGAALRSGLAAAQMPLFFYADCTTAYQPRDLGKLLGMIDHVDLASGLRVWKGSKPARTFGDLYWRLVLRFGFGLRLKDVDCSFKLFRRSIFARIPIQSDGEFVHTEILAKANFLGCMIAEVDVDYEPAAAIGLDVAARRGRRREALRLFRRPDFGPVQVPSTSDWGERAEGRPGADTEHGVPSTEY